MPSRGCVSGLALVLALSGCGHGAPADRVVTRAPSIALLARSVHSLPMTTDVPAKVERTCVATAPQTTVPVFCPRLVPKGPIGNVRNIPDRDLYGPVVFFNARDLYQMSFNDGVIAGHQHWIVGAGRPATVRRLVIQGVENEQARPAQFVGRRRVGGRLVTLYRFADPGGGMHEGHIAAFASRGAVTVFASLHGYGHADAAAAMAVDLETAPVTGRARSPASSPSG